MVVIGAGFAGLSAATHLAAQGFAVTLLERHNQAGGRARTFEEGGFRFDMGPSWYWMPDVFERYFRHFGHEVSDFYRLERLSPSYRVFFEHDTCVDMPSSMPDIEELFDTLEPGSRAALREFLSEARYKYEVGMKDMVYRPSLSILEFADRRVLKSLFQLHMFRSLRSSVRSRFNDSRLQRIMEFPVLFLGAKPQNIPALYSMMNYADLALGTWYPMGGMHEIVKAMLRVAEEQGVSVHLGEEVQWLETQARRVTRVHSNHSSYEADYVVAGADYHHVETALLHESQRSYTPEYWNSRTLAPSSLLYYVGVKSRVEGLLHHNLFFDRDFERHAEQIYDRPTFPTDPLFYVCAPSKTDATVAPEGCENLFILIPTAAGLEDSPRVREHYFTLVMQRLAERCGRDLRDDVVVRRDYGFHDFVQDYHAFRGNAYGLANTLQQTAFLKPSMRSKKIKNLLYAGQLTVPGPGVPPSLISGEVVANVIRQEAGQSFTNQHRYGYQRTL